MEDFDGYCPSCGAQILVHNITQLVDSFEYICESCGFSDFVGQDEIEEVIDFG